MEKMRAGFIGYLRPEDHFWADIQKLAALGYRGIESPEAFLMVGDVEENIKRLENMGMRVLCAYASLDAVRAHEIGDMVRAARLMKTDRVACYVSAVNGSFWNCPPTYDAVRRDIEQLELLAGELEKEGLSLTYHNHYQDFLVRYNGVTCFDMMLSQTEKLKIQLDAGWALNAGVDPCMLMRRLGNRLAALHVKDYRSGEKREDAGYRPVFTSVGCGELPVGRVLQTACEIGLDYAVVEQDEMDHLSAMQSLTAAYLNMKETGFVE